jgi:hypothetical protein
VRYPVAGILRRSRQLRAKARDPQEKSRSSERVATVVP